MQQFGTWFTPTKPAWEVELDNLTEYDFRKLNMDKEKVHKLLNQLYEWRVIR